MGVVKSLEAAEMVVATPRQHAWLELTSEARGFLERGATPESAVAAAVPEDGLLRDALLAAVEASGRVNPGGAEVGFRQASARRWIQVEKPPKVEKPSSSAPEEGGAAPEGGEAAGKGPGGKKEPAPPPRVVRGPNWADAAADPILALLASVAGGAAPSDPEAKDLAKRKLAQRAQRTTFRLERGARFARVKTVAEADLSHDLVSSGAWCERDFKVLNLDAAAPAPPHGSLHPLLKVRTAFRRIFLGLGFSEMPTDRWVESSFWNFDALFQPQMHPARDAHDTFFMADPTHRAETDDVADGYVARVAAQHEAGGHGSLGYATPWSIRESEKLLLRTHTTAVSSRMLRRAAREWRAEVAASPLGEATPFRPRRLFSIDRVFRNETLDRTHLAEFHQVEGLVLGRGLGLADLVGTLRQFFGRLGVRKLRFKPAYNPYTEPSMEVFSYSEELGKWMEVGNSGVFRPEMLAPMGLPRDVTCIAWGLSLERPTMILYGIPNIRDLFGHKVSLDLVRRNPVCRVGL